MDFDGLSGWTKDLYFLIAGTFMFLGIMIVILGCFNVMDLSHAISKIN